METNWDRFKRIYKTLLYKYIAVKYIKPNQMHRAPWNRYKSIKKVKRTRKRFLKQVKANGLDSYRILCEHYNHMVNKNITVAKGHYFDSLAMILEICQTFVKFNN